MSEQAPQPQEAPAPAQAGEAPSGLTPEAIALARTFFTAARTGSVPSLQPALEAGLPANMTNENGDTLLMLAAYHGHAEVVRLLLKHGADPNRLNDRLQSPLAGALFKDETAVVEALLEGGANPDVGQPTAWQAARMFGKLERWEGEMGRVRERLSKEGGQDVAEQ
ncbi:hypothetical protein JCM10207_005858 [Rhodosporidiobolus poonsookiae]